MREIEKRDTRFRFDGALTIKDVTKDVSLLFTYHGEQLNEKGFSPH
jgi:polyisoprenoid-binding protein YceI